MLLEVGKLKNKICFQIPEVSVSRRNVSGWRCASDQRRTCRLGESGARPAGFLSLPDARCLGFLGPTRNFGRPESGSHRLAFRAKRRQASYIGIGEKGGFNVRGRNSCLKVKFL